MKNITDDCISRQAAIDALMEILDRPNHAEFLYTDEVCKTLNELPSAQPERHKGHWIGTGSGQECSECGEVQYGYDNFRYYCAKCGSDNRGK